MQCTYIINLYIFSGDWSLLSLSTKAIGHDKLRGCDYISRNLRTSQTTKIRLQLHFGEFHESDKPTNESTHLRTSKYLNKATRGNIVQGLLKRFLCPVFLIDLLTYSYENNFQVFFFQIHTKK